jgi:hypothetical protein
MPEVPHEIVLSETTDYRDSARALEGAVEIVTYWKRQQFEDVVELTHDQIDALAEWSVKVRVEVSDA